MSCIYFSSKSIPCIKLSWVVKSLDYTKQQMQHGCIFLLYATFAVQNLMIKNINHLLRGRAILFDLISLPLKFGRTTYDTWCLLTWQHILPQRRRLCPQDTTLLRWRTQIMHIVNYLTDHEQTFAFLMWIIIVALQLLRWLATFLANKG